MKTNLLNQSLIEFYLSYDWTNDNTRNLRQIWIIQVEMIPDDRKWFVRMVEASRCDSRQNHRIEIWISWKKAWIWPWLLNENRRIERDERQRLKEAIYRHNSKSKDWWAILWERMFFDSIEAWIWESIEQVEQHHRIHQHHQTINQERLYNIKTQTDDRNKRQNN